MKQQLLLLLFGLTIFSVPAQIKGVVTDENGKPVSYVNIWIEDRNIGTTSEENGTFTINAASNEKLVFSAVGYESKTIKVSEATIIILKESVFNLDEVIVRKPIWKQEINIGAYQKKDVNFFYACWGQPWIVAKYFAYNGSLDKTPFLKKVTIMTSSYKKNTSFNMRILGANEDGSPGKELLDENIITKVKKGKADTVIDLSQYQIKIPENGLFIAFEFLIIEENKYEMDIKGQKEILYSYQPSVGTVPSEGASTWRYFMGSWSKIDKEHSSHLKEYDGKFSELAIQLTLTN